MWLKWTFHYIIFQTVRRLLLFIILFKTKLLHIWDKWEIYCCAYFFLKHKTKWKIEWNAVNVIYIAMCLICMKKRRSKEERKKLEIPFSPFSIYIYSSIHFIHESFFLKSSFFISFIKLYVYVHNHVDMIMSKAMKQKEKIYTYNCTVKRLCDSLYL